MKRTSSDFASYTRKQIGMNQSSKRRIRKEVLGMYGTLYGSVGIVASVKGFFTPLLTGPMTFTKVIVYIIVSLSASTGVYASVAPESFAKTSASLEAGVVAVVDTTLQSVGIKTNNDARVETQVEVDAGIDTDNTTESDRKGLLEVLFGNGRDADSQADSQGSTDNTNKLDTRVETEVEANAQVDLDTDIVIDEVDSILDGVIDTAGSANAGVNTIVDANSTITTTTNNSNTQTNTSIKGQIEGVINTQGTAEAMKEKDSGREIIKETEPEVNTTSKTTSESSVQGKTTDDTIEGTVQSTTESDTAIGIGL